MANPYSKLYICKCILYGEREREIEIDWSYNIPPKAYRGGGSGVSTALRKHIYVFLLGLLGGKGDDKVLGCRSLGFGV